MTLLTLPIAALFLASCAPGSGDGLNVSGRPLAEGADVPLAATLESIQINVFDASCVVCHAGSAAPCALILATLTAVT
jgi:cytochrome c5